jgi:predicted DNA-binding protein with PD1-like motif
MRFDIGTATDASEFWQLYLMDYLTPPPVFASKKVRVQMRSKRIVENPKTFVVVLDTGDELLSSLKTLARIEHLSGSSFKAIGALSNVELGWFSWETKKYETAVKLQEEVELLSLIGDIALNDHEPRIDAHVVIGRQDGTAHGGHLLNAIVRPTCEIIVTESPQHLQRSIRNPGSPSSVCEDCQHSPHCSGRSEHRGEDLNGNQRAYWNGKQT